eukprot:scaffold244146_cov45-Prasinocladus_malaysianus.AAC.1
MNAAWAADVAVIAVPAHTKVESVVHIACLASSASMEGELAATAPRMLVCLGEGAMAEVIEEHQVYNP